MEFTGGKQVLGWWRLGLGGDDWGGENGRDWGERHGRDWVRRLRARAREARVSGGLFIRML
jgi:hypothetical protein